MAGVGVSPNALLAPASTYTCNLLNGVGNFIHEEFLLIIWSERIWCFSYVKFENEYDVPFSFLHYKFYNEIKVHTRNFLF